MANQLILLVSHPVLKALLPVTEPLLAPAATTTATKTPELCLAHSSQKL